MGHVLGIIQWVLLVLIVAYLVVGTIFMISTLNGVSKSLIEGYTILSERQSINLEMENARADAKECEVKDDCAYGKFVYEGKRPYKALSDKVLSFIMMDCTNKDKLASPIELPAGLICSCIDKKCVSIS